jgi:hypothetical protein
VDQLGLFLLELIGVHGEAGRLRAIEPEMTARLNAKENGCF